MSTPEHWQRNPRYRDREDRTRKAHREMLLVAFDRTPSRRIFRRLWLRWRLWRHR